MLWGMSARLMGRTHVNRNENMDQIERLLGLYKGAQTEAEKHILLETVRISSPGDFPRLEERILRDQVRGMPFEQLVQLIASHRRIPPQQAGELLRDAVFENLLDRASLKVEGSAPPAPDLESGRAPGATAPCTPSPPAPPAAAGTAAAESQNGASPDKAVEVIIIQDPGEREAIPTVLGNVKPEGNQNGDSTAPPASASFSRLHPRGIGG
jgi:hypothetical protein